MINELEKWEYRLFVQSLATIPQPKPPATVGELTGDIHEGMQMLGLEGWQLASFAPIGEDTALLVFARPHEEQRAKSWALEYLDSTEINFCETLVPGSITHLVCCPFRLGPDAINFESEDMKDWREQYRLRYDQWRPSDSGMRVGWRTPSDIERGEPLWEIYGNGTVSSACTTYTVERHPEEASLVSIAAILRHLGGLLELCKDLYVAIGYDGPAILRTRVTNCEQLSFQIPVGPSPFDEPYAAESRFAVRDGVLQVDDYLSAKELTKDPVPILRGMGERIYHALGLWRLNVPDQELEEALAY